MKPAVEQRGEADWSDNYVQNAIFCANNSQVLVSAEYGSIHSARVDPWPLKLEFKQIGRLTGSSVSFRIANDKETIFAYDSVRLAAGTCDELRTITEHDSKILQIASDGQGNLVLISGLDLLRLGRAFYLWGMPVWSIDWPEILPEPDQ